MKHSAVVPLSSLLNTISSSAPNVVIKFEKPESVRNSVSSAGLIVESSSSLSLDIPVMSISKRSDVLLALRAVLTISLTISLGLLGYNSIRG